MEAASASCVAPHAAHVEAPRSRAHQADQARGVGDAGDMMQMRALYDLSRYLTSFNVFEWLVQAEANGATVIVFDIRGIRGDKWQRHIALKRFWSICHPAPALIGLPCEVFGERIIGRTDARDIAKPGGRPLVEFWNAGKRFKRFRSVKPPGRDRYTVTLRNTQRAPGRNSDDAVWREFAREIGARVIPDYEDEPIHLHDRMALYAGAEMNFFCSNGPGIMCSMSEYPCMMFNTYHAKNSLADDGIEEGGQYPWMLANQRAIWEEASSDSLRRHFYHWREKGTFADDAYVPAAAA